MTPKERAAEVADRFYEIPMGSAAHWSHLQALMARPGTQLRLPL